MKILGFTCDLLNQNRCLKKSVFLRSSPKASDLYYSQSTAALDSDKIWQYGPSTQSEGC